MKPLETNIMRGLLEYPQKFWDEVVSVLFSKGQGSQAWVACARQCF